MGAALDVGVRRGHTGDDAARPGGRLRASGSGREGHGMDGQRVDHSDGAGGTRVRVYPNATTRGQGYSRGVLVGFTTAENILVLLDGMDEALAFEPGRVELEENFTKRRRRWWQV